MKDASIQTLKVLQERGYRVTQARTEIIKKLVTSTTPVTIQELAQKVGADEVSVYRTIALLREESLIEELNTKKGIARYSLVHGHHHHVVCTSCGKVLHIECDTEPKIPRRIPGFTEIGTHELTFYGTCTSCA